MYSTNDIKSISFAEILPIWKNDLWPNRVSEITATSAMCFLGGYSYENMEGSPTFLGYFVNNELVGVNSGHYTKHNDGYRSRGLYVFPEFRRQGIGIALLKATIAWAKNENATMCWSYPKYTSWKTYQTAGFILASDWEKSEMSDKNAYCRFEF
jgi:GNAT superfamily N-acetyltransferase